MSEILALLQNIASIVSPTSLQQMSHVIYGTLITNGRITMLEISRWTEIGGSYRTLQRWYHSSVPWLSVMWVLFSQQLWTQGHDYIAAGDEVVFGKAGKETYGLGRFFSSLQQLALPGLSFFAFSVIDVQERRSYPLQVAIEFNFRDAKQYWGLDDFMNIKKTAVTNAAHLSFFMVNFSLILLRRFQALNPEFSILDLKSYYGGCRYVSETLKLLPQKLDAILLAAVFEQIVRLGMIHPAFDPSPTS